MCAGCGHFSVLNALDGSFGRLGIDGKDALVVAGIGCSGTIQNHVPAYGYHALHGRALPSAAGAKMANPELTVIAAGGDGDGLAIGGGHLMHTFRNNPSIAYNHHEQQHLRAHEGPGLAHQPGRLPGLRRPRAGRPGAAGPQHPRHDLPGAQLLGRRRPVGATHRRRHPSRQRRPRLRLPGGHLALRRLQRPLPRCGPPTSSTWPARPATTRATGPASSRNCWPGTRTAAFPPGLLFLNEDAPLADAAGPGPAGRRARLESGGVPEGPGVVPGVGALVATHAGTRPRRPASPQADRPVHSGPDTGRM